MSYLQIRSTLKYVIMLSRHYMIPLLAVVFLTTPGVLKAQDNQDDEVFELSPFEVSGDSDVGYSASQSVLGTRTRQLIKDIPSQIEVITPEFMDDFGITSIDDAFRYSINVEGGEEFISWEDGGSEAVAWSGKTVGRIRGIYNSTFSTSRNLFSSITKSDSYNTQRMSIASGAQSMLFSLGPPAGNANITLKSAQMRDFGQINLLADSEDGWRYTLDVNRELWEDKLAIRVAYMNEDEKSFLKPSFDKEERVYGTLTFKPFTDTTIRVHGETVNAKANKPIRQYPWDFATPGIEALQTGDTSDVPFGNPDRGRSPSFVSGANDAPMDYFHRAGYRKIAGPGTLPFWPEKYGVARDPNSGVARVTFNPENVKLFPEVEQVIGRNFFGDNILNHYDSKIFDAFIEQQIFDVITIEVAGHTEEWEYLNESAARVNNFAYYLDLDEYIPTEIWTANGNWRKGVPNENTAGFMPNPNYGKLFTTGVANGRWRHEETEEWRASIAWNPVTPEKIRWLGDHSFLGTYSERAYWWKSNDIQWKVSNKPLEYQNNNTGWGANRIPQLVHYFDTGDNLVFQLPDGADSISHLYSGDFTYTIPSTGEVLTFGGWGDPGQAFRLWGDKNDLESTILAWQGRYFNDRLLLSYGFRRDTASVETMNQGTSGPNRDPDWHNAHKWWYDAVWDGTGFVEETNDSNTYGLVARPLSWLSLSYYESNTVNISSGWLTPFGEPIPGSNGDSKDYAIRLDSPDGKSFLKLTYYEVQQFGNNVGRGLVRIDALRLEKFYRNVVNELDPEDPPDGFVSTYEKVYFGEQGFASTAVSAFNGLNDGTFPVIGDRTSEGLEITAGTHWKGWNFRLSYATNETTNTDASGEWLRWQQERLPVWSSVTDASGDGWDEITWAVDDDYQTIDQVTGETRTMTMKEFYEQVTLLALDTALQLNNQPVDKNPKHRINFNTSYEFRDGKWKGLRLGGAIRYRSAPIIGFAVKDSGYYNGDYPTPALDLEKPYKGDEYLDADLFASYSGKNFMGWGLKYRIQINVRNLFTSEGSYSSTRVNAFGESVFTTLDVPRWYSLSLRLDF